MNATSARTLRWVILVPAVLTLFFTCVLLSIGIYKATGFMAGRLLCSDLPELSNTCTEDYLNLVKEGLLFFMPAIAAVLMVLSAYRIAPSHKVWAAISTFILGSLAALSYALDSNYWHSFVLTELLAFAMLFYLYKKQLPTDHQ